eukprot:jgi/Botrbrau1/8675/Bobra.0087s0028.1
MSTIRSGRTQASKAAVFLKDKGQSLLRKMPLGHIDQTSTALESPAACHPSHHSPDGRFINPWDTWKEASLWDVLQWQWQRVLMRVPSASLVGNRSPSPADFERAFPVHAPLYRSLAAPPGDAVQATWVGHATLLVQMEGFTFLTDPVFSQRCSPVQWAGPKRLVRVPFEIEDPKLPALDFVIVSHNHYDHLDKGSVRRLAQTHGPSLCWYVPLGLGPWFAKQGVPNVVELDWWDEVTHCCGDRKMTIALTPTQHWSARSINDRRKTLWGSYAILGSNLRFWFSGDTGYAPVFKDIGRRYGPFDLAAVPTGAYEPRWFMRSQHVDPKEAVQVHKDVGAMNSVAIHCSTFSLADEPLDEPPGLLAKCLGEAGLPPDAFVTLQHGGMIQAGGGRVLNKPPTLGTPGLGELTEE